MADLLPLGDEIGIGVALLDAEIVEFLADSPSFVIQVVDVARPLVVQLENGPLRFNLPLPLMALVLSCHRERDSNSITMAEGGGDIQVQQRDRERGGAVESGDPMAVAK